MPGCSNPVKTVVVIGNGPSALTLSYLLSGSVPYYDGGCDDAALHARLGLLPSDESLVAHDLQQLASGCEGRSTNPVAVMFDSLSHPDADLGVERPSLLSWRHRPDLAVDHVVIGKGKPGGCWQSMDGTIQTVSLGNWMELPDMQLEEVYKVDSDNRVPVAAVAKYYETYAETKGISKHFVNCAVVTSVKEVSECEAICFVAKREISSTPDFGTYAAATSVRSERRALVGALQDNALLERLEESAPKRRSSSSEGEVDSAFFSSPLTSTPTLSACSTFSRTDDAFEEEDALSSTLGTTPFGQQIQLKYHEHLRRHNSQADCASAADFGITEALNGLDLCCSWDPIVNPKLFCQDASGLPCSLTSTSRSRSSSWSSFPCRPSLSRCASTSERLFEVQGHYVDAQDKKPFRYLARNVVLATGSYDVPNSLNVAGRDLPFVFHTLRQLEDLLKLGALSASSDPVLIVGAGLSAADAVIMTEKMGVPVVHAFRRSVTDSAIIFKKLPAKLYPEYHRVFQMMCGEPGARSSTYTALQGHQVTEILAPRKVLLRLDSEQVQLKVSCVVILIGASPDLSFLDPKLLSNLGIIKDVAIGRNNPVDIDLFTNEAVEVPGIYAMGPLVGDNFVRFLQGGALAIASDIMKKERKHLMH